MIKLWIKLFRCEWKSVDISDIIFNISCESKKFAVEIISYGKLNTDLNPFEYNYCPWCGKKIN